MEDKLYKAIAQIILQEQVDEWGNKVRSPLGAAIDAWFNDSKNQQKLRDLVADKIDVDKLAGLSAEYIKKDFSTNSWLTSTMEQKREKLTDRVLELVAEKLAAEQIKKLKKESKNK